jgi:hypothetical protein
MQPTYRKENQETPKDSPETLKPTIHAAASDSTTEDQFRESARIFKRDSSANHPPIISKCLQKIMYLNGKGEMLLCRMTKTHKIWAPH